MVKSTIQWRKVETWEAKVVVEALSNLAPLKNIGAIIIDEEHEALTNKIVTRATMRGKSQS